jgi:hypothetical protein
LFLYLCVFRSIEKNKQVVGNIVKNEWFLIT